MNYNGGMTEEHTSPQSSMDDTHKSIDQKLDQLIECQALTLKTVNNVVLITCVTVGLVGIYGIFMMIMYGDLM